MIEYYIGLSLAPSATIETGVAVLDNNNKFILIDKLFTMKDVQHFFDNFSSLKQSRICISLPWDNTLMTGKWRILSKPYQFLHTQNKMDFINTDNWLQRFSNRGCDYFYPMLEKGIDITRFDLYLAKQKLDLYSHYKLRSPADCKFLQNILKVEYGFNDIPANMMPAGALEGMIGALVAREKAKGNWEKLFEFKGFDVINVKESALVHKLTSNQEV
mgnify:CR=1 FL=1